MITREEYKQYMKIKKKIETMDIGIQTDSQDLLPYPPPPPIPPQVIIIPMSFDENGETYDDYDYEDEYEEDDDEDDEDYEPENEIYEEKPPPKKRKLNYRGEERNYYQSLHHTKKKDIDDIENQIIDINYLSVPMRFKILESDMDLKLKALAISKVEQLNNIDPSSGEYLKLSTWIENLCKLPIGKYKKLPIDSSESVEDITLFLDKIKKNLDTKVFGHEDAKNQIIRLLAKWIANPASKGLVIGIEGAMGVGKTSLCNSICESLELPFGFLQLGGISDGSYLVGFNYTYEGSRWGRIADLIMKAGCMNPVLFFDELDKISQTRYGEEVANILIHLTDSTQNDKFHDKYFNDIEFDLSKCLIVFSYNNEELISPILKDRMVRIKASGYSLKDKISISKNHLIPELCKNYAFKTEDIVFEDDIISHIVSIIAEEQGVRNLKRALEEIISQINLHKLLKKNINDKKPLIFPCKIEKYIVDVFCKTHKKNDWTAKSSMYI